MTRKYNNKHLVEVNCGFHFLDDESDWDSTYFGQFYDLIKSKGYDEKIERKGVELTVNDEDDSISKEIERQVVFKNSKSGKAILLTKDKISFHSVENYKDWEEFINNFVKPMFTIYESLGLGKGRFRFYVIYLNRFKFNISENLSNYLIFLKDIEHSCKLVEIDTKFQRVFTQDSLTLILKGNCNIDKSDENSKILHLECGSYTTVDKMDNIYETINEVHNPIRNLFESAITDNLKDLL